MNDIMRKGVDCFIAYADKETTQLTVLQLRRETLVNKIYVMMTGEEECQLEECEVMHIDHLQSTSTIRQIAAVVTAPLALVCTKQMPITLGYQAVKRMADTANGIGAFVVYADRYVAKNGETMTSPTMDFCEGSIRDDFDFGSLQVYSAAALREYASRNAQTGYCYSGWYDLNLYGLRTWGAAAFFHLREYLYTEEELDLRKSGEKQFDYVDPRNRTVQLER